MEEILALKAEESGKALSTEEEEYVRLQFERNSLIRLFPNSEDRDEDMIKRIQKIKDRVKKLAKNRPTDDVLKLPFKSAQPKSAAVRKANERKKKSLEAREKERENDRKRKASPEELEKTKKRLKTPENRKRDADRKRAKRRAEKVERGKEEEWPRAPRLSGSIVAGAGRGDLKVKLPSDDLRAHMSQYWNRKTLSRRTVQGPTYSMDQPLRIRAEFECFPPPTIVWLKDGKVLAKDTIKYAPREGVTSSADCQKERLAPKSKLRFEVESYYRFKLPVTSETVSMPGAWGDPNYKYEKMIPAQLMYQGWSDFIIPKPQSIDEGIYEVRIFNSFGVVEDFIQVRKSSLTEIESS